MELSELIQCIDEALCHCQSIIDKKPIVVWSEADLERLLANNINNKVGIRSNNELNPDFSVHTQISHYVDEKAHLDIRPDIILLNDSILEKARKEYKSGKGVRYEGPSIAIELKYLRVGMGASIVKQDFEKWETKLDDKTWLYVVVLFDIPTNPRSIKIYEKKETDIYQMSDEMREKFPQDKDRIYCKVLKKIFD